MTNDDKKLLKLCRSSFDDENLDKEAFGEFSRDYAKYSNGELTFRELILSIRTPKGKLKEALQAFYDNSHYSRVFKGR